jgi:N-methylhydantoinase A/oxoprolinase/acetone carboxylase beta subunit
MAVATTEPETTPTGEQGGGRYRFGFDIGGTFTDFVLMEVASGRTATYKTLTTPGDPSVAVLEGWRALLAETGADPSAVEQSVHGTTLITNALIERDGATTGLIATKGFRDTLELRREMRYDIYDLLITLPEPLVPRPLRLELDERMDASGGVRTAPDLSELEPVRNAFRAAGVEAVAVCFLHSFTNDAHERAVGAWLAEHMPEVAVSLSCEVAPEIREYERTSTTVANAYVQPVAQRYLTVLGQRLAEAGFEANLYLMLSNGGITTLETATRFPIRLVESGPAAGVLAAVFHGAGIGKRDLVSFDMGGTTAKMCLIKDGDPAMSSSFEIARVHRFKRGSGLPVQVRSIDLIEIGAGGGSIARVDELGLLKVGPRSAGADPGPACYGLGGTDPTVTDADLVLGYLNPDNFLGGRMQLTTAAAEEAISRAIATPMGLDVVAAAHGIYEVVNESMIAATRIHVAERGADVRRVFLMAFGGAGPVHADAIARALKMPGFIVPPGAGVTSALGFLTAPTSFELARSVVGKLTTERLAELDRIYEELEAEGRALLEQAAVDPAEMRFVRRADLRHAGQGHEIVLDLPFPQLAGADLDAELAPRFYDAHEAVYGHAHRHLSLEIVAVRVSATGAPPHVTAPAATAETGSDSATGSRPAYVKALGGFVDVDVHARAGLAVGATLQGPVIVEEPNSTTIVGPDATLVVDELGDLVVEFA